MNTSRKTLATLIIGLTGCAAVPAQAEDNFYATAIFGAGFLGSEDLEYTSGTTTGSANADFDASFASGATLGYRFDNGWNIETELMYRRNDLEEVTVPGFGLVEEGDYASLSIGLNALYRFKFDSMPKLSAYAGGGFVYLQEIDIDFETDGVETSFETSDTAFQIKVGGRYDFSDRWFADAGITYLAASGVEMEFEGNNAVTVKADYGHTMASLGIGFRF